MILTHIIEIELCEEGEDLPDLSKPKNSQGVRYEFPMPVANQPTNESEIDSVANSIPLDELMAKLKNL
jgi:hypothetical protein